MWVGFSVVALMIGLQWEITAAITAPDSEAAANGPPKSQRAPELVLFSRTPVAPSGAEGSAKFASSSSGRISVNLELRGFEPGDYELGIVRKTDENFVPLARFSIVDPTIGPDADTAQNTKTTTNGRQAQTLVSQNVLPLPPDLDLALISKLVVADLSGNYLLMSEFR